MKIKIFFLFLFPILCMSLENQPWFGNPYEFTFFGSYTYSYYKSVDAAVPSLSSRSNDHLIYMDLEYPFSTKVSMDINLELVKTPRQSFGFRALAAQVRYLLYDDIIGDPVSLSINGDIRGVSTKSIEDISCPYHGEINFEGSFALGKEISSMEYWQFRLWLNGKIGFSNRGSPWIIGILSFDGNIQDQFRYSVFLEGMQGYGRNTKVKLNDFNGYGHIRHKNIDIGFRFGKAFSVYGSIIFEYRRRLYAKRFPEKVNFFELGYLSTFSF